MDNTDGSRVCATCYPWSTWPISSSISSPSSSSLSFYRHLMLLLINVANVIITSVLLDGSWSGSTEMRIVFLHSSQQMTSPSKEAHPALRWNEVVCCISCIRWCCMIQHSTAHCTEMRRCAVLANPPPSSWPGHLWWAIASQRPTRLRKWKWNKRTTSAKTLIL